MEDLLKYFSNGAQKELDRYFAFISSCQLKYESVALSSLPEEQKPSQLHHIYPKYKIQDYLKHNRGILSAQQVKEIKTFQECSKNVVLLSALDHIEAHRILYETFNDRRDLGAIQLLTGSLSEAKTSWRIAGANAVHKIHESVGSFFWSRDFQKEQARKANLNPNIRQIRSVGGKKGAKNANLNRVLTKNERYLFSLNDQPFLCIFGYEDTTELIDLLNSISPSNLNRISPLLTGTRKKAYGWSCVCLYKDPAKRDRKKAFTRK